MAKKQREADVENEVQEGSARVYELGFHLDPELAVEEVKKAYNEIRAVIAKSGEVVAEGEPEKVALAYTISRQETSGRRDFDSAYFAWVAYEAPIASHEEIVAAVKGNSKIVRFIDLVTDKEAARAAEERAELAQKVEAPEPEAEAEPATEDASLDAALENATL